MKKTRVLVMLVLILCLIPLVTAFAETGKVNTSALNMRSSASTDATVKTVLHHGDKVTIKSKSGSWYKISCNGKTGYVIKKYITIVSEKSKTDKSKTGDSKKAKISSDGTCKIGDKGDAVRKVQKRLKTLGYLNGNADGDFGKKTKAAVENFQKRNGLKVTGKVNSTTLDKLNSKNAKKASSSDTASSSGKAERLNWFKGGSNTIPKGAVFKVKDIRTGKVFTVRRWSGYNHLDAEPLTRSDTNTMKSIYGHWSWRRRPILVKYNGHVYAASMNGMPHGTSTISNNGFDGHFCIHFYGSKTHGSKKVDAQHQSCVAAAMNHSW